METMRLQQSLAMLLSLLGGCYHLEALGIIGAPHPTVFVLADIVIRQKIDGASLPGQGLEECCRRLHVPIISIYTFDERDTDKKVLASLCEITDILKDQFISNTRI